jgi:hypothetical protein
MNPINGAAGVKSFSKGISGRMPETLFVFVCKWLQIERDPIYRHALNYVYLSPSKLRLSFPAEFLVSLEFKYIFCSFLLRRFEIQIQVVWILLTVLTLFSF